MVRVISSGFSTPRSRHSSGEDMIDRFAAMKALSALNDAEKLYMYKDRFGSGNLMMDSNTDTNDSFSGVDSEEDAKLKSSEKTIGDTHLNQDPIVIKKERRKERNKLSAQNYRQRRRQQASSSQKTLDSLEAHNKVLLEKVQKLEAEKHIVEEYLRNCTKIPVCPHHYLPKTGNPPPHPPTIPEHAPVTKMSMYDNMPMQIVPENMNSNACVDVNFNTTTVNTHFTTTLEYNNNTINNNYDPNKPVPMDSFPTAIAENNNNYMPMRMAGTSSQLCTGSSVS